MRIKGLNTGMDITRKSLVSGKIRTKTLEITKEEYQLWKMGCNIQDAMPRLTPDEREFIMTGIIPDEWNEVFYSLGDNVRIMGHYEE